MEKTHEGSLESDRPIFEKIAATSDAPIAELIRLTYGANIATYFESPIEDQNYLETLKVKSVDFEINGKTAPFKLIKEFTFDLGGSSLNDSLTASVINTEKSKELMKFISKKLSSQVTLENTGVVFINRRIFDPMMSRRVGAFAFGQREFLLIITSDTEKKARNSIGIHILDDSGFNTLFYKHFDSKEEEVTNKLDKLIPPQSKRFTGFYNKILALKDDRWKPSKLKILDRFFSRERTWEHGTIATVKRTTKRIFAWKTYEVYAAEEEDEEEVDEKDLLNLYSSALLAMGTQNAEFGGYIIPGGIGTTSMINISTSPDDDPTGEIRYGPPNGGVAGCTGYQSVGGCKACCIAYRVAALTAVAAAWGKCHASVGCYPVAHGACVVAGGAAAALVWMYFNNCEDHCEKEYWHEY